MAVDKSIKLLWVTNTIGVGGSERQLIYMYHILQKYDFFDITVLFYARADHELSSQGIKTVFVDKNKIGRIRTIWEIHKYIQKNNIQIVHALGGCSANIYGRAGAVFSRAIPIGAMKGKKHFVRLGNKIGNSLLNLFGNWWMVNNKELIPILKRDLKFVDDKKIRMIHNGFLPADQINYRKDEITEYDNAKGNDFVFCAVGRLEPVKNYSLLINAAEDVIYKNKNVQLWIIGDGAEYEHLSELIKQKGIDDKVILWGYRNDIDVALSRCDVFVQTSITEGSPNTITEAMRAGKPIISTKSTDLSEMIEVGNNGEIVTDRDELSNAMEKMLCTTQKERTLMGKRSNELFMQHFQDRTVAKEYIDFYNEVLIGR